MAWRRLSRAGLWAAGLAAAASFGCAPQPQVWFTPNLGSPDMLALFSHGEQWELARSHVDVFKFYSQQLALTSEKCPLCGANVFQGFAAEKAFTQLRAWKIAVAAEVAVVKPYACVSDSTADLAERAIDNVAAAGGEVAYLAMDEPLASGDACGYGPAEVASETARFVHRIQAAHAGILVGDIEPFPLFDVATLRTWLDALDADGVKPAFLHFDVDHGRVQRESGDLASDLRDLKALSAERSLPFTSSIRAIVSFLFGTTVR